jgi:DAK2 domain fusion protein YloV
MPAEVQPAPSRSLDGRTIRHAMGLYREVLEVHRREIDSLNVYPVADGDTGTNLLLTQQSVVEALAALDPGEEDLAILRPVICRAALMGARGNSGVILAQILRGILDRLPSGAFGTSGASGGSGVSGPSVGPGTAADVVAGLWHATEEAYRAVARPVEGTALSVMRDAAAAAEEASRGSGDVLQVLDAALAGARESLARTTELLPQLRRAGVVDAGGKGLVLLFDALRAALCGELPSEPVGPLGPLGRPESEGPGATPAMPGQERASLGFEVQYLLEAGDEEVPGLRSVLAGLGTSLVVVGGGGVVKVHVHTGQPGAAVEAALEAGRPRQISISSLDGQVGCLVRTAVEEAAGVLAATHASALVAVAEGEGLVRTFRSLGASVVVGGPGNNPAVADLVRAIRAAPSSSVLVLPNHRNVVPAAERAAGEVSKDVTVVPARSIPAGIAAAAVFNPNATSEENAEALRAAAAGCGSGEVVQAERDADTPTGAVRRGAWLGMAEGRAVSVGLAGSPSEAASAWAVGPGAPAVEVVRHLAREDSGVVTLVVGDGAGAEERSQVEAAIRETFPGLDVEIVDGGQPRFPFLIGVE